MAAKALLGLLADEPDEHTVRRGVPNAVVPASSLHFPYSVIFQGGRVVGRVEPHHGDGGKRDGPPRARPAALHHVHVPGGRQERARLLQSEQGELPDHDAQRA